MIKSNKWGNHLGREGDPTTAEGSPSDLDLCTSLENDPDTVAVLMKQSLLMRRLFALFAPLVPVHSPQYPLAQKILNSLSCVTSGKTIVSWNVDSLRARIVDNKISKSKKMKEISADSPMGQLIDSTHPDIICLQETKLKKEDEGHFHIEGYHTYWSSSTEKKGYSGVAIWSREKPLRVTDRLHGIDPRLENEGRILTAYYPGYVIVNTYVPNTLRAGEKPYGGWGKVRDPTKRLERQVDYEKYIGARQQWDAAISAHLNYLHDEVGNVIWCGDLNVARSLLDIHNGEMTKSKLADEKAGRNRGSRVKELERRIQGAESAFLHGGGAGLRLEERSGIERVLEDGFCDAFRVLYPKLYGFTYWDRTKIHFRGANNGWRIDYFILTPGLMPCIESIRVLKDIGVVDKQVPSDHAPIVLKFF